MATHEVSPGRTRKLTSFQSRPKVLVLFGTRPEVIKLAPVIHELKRREIDTVVISSSQHKQLLRSFVKLLNVKVDFDLGVMKANQTPNLICSRVLSKLDALLEHEKPDLIVVQGDTTTTLAGALAGFNRRIPVAHVEAGLRSGDLLSPFPEEMNRRVVSKVATLHLAATESNRRNLIAEGLTKDSIIVTGNPVVDSLQDMANNSEPSLEIKKLIEATDGKKRILLTTHRRESFGKTMLANLRVLADFVKRRRDVCLIFPVHPNPNVLDATKRILSDEDRVHLLKPLGYLDFVALMKASWLIVSDSGGVQEEAPSLGKPLLVLRENTERSEAIDAGVARLVGGDAKELKSMLEANYESDLWVTSVSKVPNPFGDGTASVQIVNAIEKFFEGRT